MKERFSFTHADAKQGDGIDLSGDFCEPAFWEQINDRSYDVIICSNLLTHVFDRDIIINNIKRLAKEKSYIVVTSPFIYPYCADPYDSKFRPDCQQLLGLFPELELLDAATVSSGTGHVYRLLRNKRDLASFLINVILPRKGMKRWRNVASDVPNIFMHFQTSCVFLQSVSRTKAVSDFAAGR
ncbi:methyltransferase domain-containing protein [Methylocystis sp. H62]|uniref:methyltransferase domain-containing protein n=1 Tax=Methylocystis sp. H62 TaxID=2785789 RepID=UPI003916D77A